MQSHVTNEYSRSGQRSSPQFPQQTSSQYQPQRSLQYPPETSSQYSPQNSFQPPPPPPQRNQPETRSQYTPQSSFQPPPPQRDLQPPLPPPPQRDLQPPLQTNRQSDVTLTQQQAVSQGRGFQTELNTQQNHRILTSVQPLANPVTQQNRNFVHSSPSYSKTKIYSSQQSQPNPSGIYSDRSSSSSNQYNPSLRGSEDIGRTEQSNRQSHSNRELHSFDETMDLLDSYANFETTRRLDGQNGRANERANVMTVERTNTNRDHEIPIYNRSERRPSLRFSSNPPDDLQTQETEQAVLLNNALKLMLSPYTKSAALKNGDVDEMTTKILGTVINEAAETSDVTFQVVNKDGEIINDKLIQSEWFRGRNTNTVGSQIK